MRQAVAALMMTLLLVVTGCEGQGQPTPEARARQHYAGLTGFTAQGEIRADYGDKVYEFQVSVAGDLNSGTLKVTAPASVAGTSFTWMEGVGAVAYGEITLETGTLSPDGLSPVDAVPVVLQSLATGTTVTACLETLEGEEVLFWELVPPGLTAEESTVLVWLGRQEWDLLGWEITSRGRTVVSGTMTQYSDTTEG